MKSKLAARHTGHRKPSSCPAPAEERRAAEARAPHPGRGRADDRGREEQPPRSPGRHHDLGRLPAWPTCRRGCRSLEWSQVDFALATLHVRRVKSGKPSTHPIRGDETACPPQATARRHRSRLSCSCRSAAARSPRTASIGWSSGQERKAKLPFQAHANMLKDFWR